GDFAAAFREGRTDGLLPGEALKNLTHRTAREFGTGEIEELGLALCRRALADHPLITRARVEITEQSWNRLEAGGKVQGQAFVAGGPELKTVAITSNGQQTAVVSGIEQLSMMGTAGFAPARRDAHDDGSTDGLQRLLVGALSARWTYATSDVTFQSYRHGVRSAMIETFTRDASHSVEHTLYAIADVVFATYLEIVELTLALHE